MNITPIILEAQKYHRKHPFLSASTSLMMVRFRHQPTFTFKTLRNGDQVAKLEREGFDIEVRIVPDNDSDMSDLGTFTDAWEEGAVRNPNHRHDSHVYAWFVPERATMEELYPWYREQGSSKAVARERVRQAAEEDAQYAADNRSYGVIVTASKAGVELGSESLWGVTFDDDFDWEGHHYTTDLAENNGMITLAIEEAREALPSLLEKLNA